jgi:hypothetical protein
VTAIVGVLAARIGAADPPPRPPNDNYRPADAPRPITFIASAIIDPTSAAFAGSTIVVPARAMFPNWPMYCSATRSCTASKPPGSWIASATLRMPCAVASATARMAAACPSASLICCWRLASTP